MRITLPNPVQSTAEARPSHVVLITREGSLTACELRDAVIQRAAWLYEQGLRSGDRVALLAPPCRDWIIDWHALGWLGCVVAPLPHQAPGQEIAWRVEALRPRALITCLPGLAPEGLKVLDMGRAEADALPPVPERFWPLEEPRVVVFTSGTTGGPRAIELSTAQLVFSALGSSVRLGHEPGDRWLACLPLHHVGGLSILSRCAMMATCVVLHPRFDADRVARALDSGQATLVSLVPTMLRRVLDARADRPFPETLRVILVGGASIPEELLERCRRLRAPVALTWGMSEAASQIATRFVGDLSPDAGSGPPLPFSRVALEDRNLIVRGPIVGGAALETPDIGYVDDVGRVHVLGRADDVMVSGGEKLLPEEIEAVLEAHPGVADAGVVGRRDVAWGERPVAFLVKSPDVQETPDPAALRCWCKARLESFKTPDAFIWLETLPYTELGKLSRARLRARLVEQDAPQRSRPEASPVAVRDEVLGQLTDAAAGEGHRDAHVRLMALRQWLGTDLEAVEAELLALGRLEAHVAHRAAGHLLARAGKRVRPLCVLLAGRLGDEALGEAEQARLRQVATAAELVHTATLLHDDVIDHGEQRRGGPCAHRVYGNKASVLGGDHLLTEALALTRANAEPESLDALIAVIREMVAAEALQLEQQGRFELREDVYMQIALGKTASLFHWSFRAGAHVGGLSREQVDAAGEMGQQIGLAFQLIDDVLDIEGDMARMGKAPLNDLREGKMTWPLLRAVERAPELREALRRFAMGALGEADALVSRIVATGALDETRDEASRRLGVARERLTHFPDSRARRALATVIDSMAQRVR